MNETPRSENVSTKLQRIAEIARRHPEAALKTLAHHIDMDLLEHAFKVTRKNATPGVDGESAEEFKVNLRARLESLQERMHKGTYRAPPVQRAYIPKDNGETRRIGIPTFEDKVLQRAVALVLGAVYEQSFLECSFGFRPGRSAHQALRAIWKELMDLNGGWVIEADIESFFDSLDHRLLREIFEKRIQDGVLCRMIGKWLNAGVLENGTLHYTEEGAPQGGVISPFLANIFLHEVLDAWFEREVKPRLEGRAKLVRYADDFVIICARRTDAMRIFEVLPKRFARYGLRLHPLKTRIIHSKPVAKHKKDSDEPPNHFDFLGFTHYWAKSRKGRWWLTRKTMSSRITRTLKRIREWCRINRHADLEEQRKILSWKLKGHYAYFGITGNWSALQAVYFETERIWHYWLERRSQRGKMNWPAFRRLLSQYPLPAPRIVHSALSTVAKP